MKTEYIDLHEIKDVYPAASACIGYFDGVHKGHQKLMERTLIAAKAKKLTAACITFDPDPWVVLKNAKNIPHLTSVKERIRLIENTGIEVLYLVRFTKELADLSPAEFIEKILVPLNIRHLVCGFDYSYGKYGAGKAEDLKKERAFDTEVVGAVLYENEKISSTRIEECLRKGEADKARVMLGYPYSITGTVVKGRSKGKTIGFPTANIKPGDIYVMPKPAVYAGICEVAGKEYRAMINIGHNSSFNRYEDLSLEAHLIGFEGNLYRKKITVRFYRFVRDEIEFSSLDELKAQLTYDRGVISSYSFEEDAGNVLE